MVGAYACQIQPQPPTAGSPELYRGSVPSRRLRGTTGALITLLFSTVIAFAGRPFVKEILSN